MSDLKEIVRQVNEMNEEDVLSGLTIRQTFEKIFRDVLVTGVLAQGGDMSSKAVQAQVERAMKRTMDRLTKSLNAEAKSHLDEPMPRADIVIE